MLHFSVKNCNFDCYFMVISNYDIIIYWKQMMKTEFYPAAIPLPIIALFIKY